jgi:membrane-associated protein
MQTLLSLFNFILHIDTSLGALIATYGPLTYGILFIILFCETGLVITPFLPGDSLLFAAGTFAALGSLRLDVLVVLCSAAAILGDAANYAVGRFIGPRAFTARSRFFKHEHLVRTHAFFEKYGGKAIVLARFVPIVRTFAPFVAGIGGMRYRHFAFFNILGAILWVIPFTAGGFLFGNVPVVRNNFELVILVIIVLSLMPMAIEWWRHRGASRAR